MDKEINSPIVDPAHVRSLMENPDVVIVDARGGADARRRYMAGHLKGAILMDLETDLSEKEPDPSKGGRHPLPDAKKFGELLGRVGITPASYVLVYDDKAGANAAARFWWMMKAAGHTRVQVIDGGQKALQEEGHELTTAMPERMAAPPYPVESWSLPVVDMETVDRARNQKDSLVIDVREGYRYRGESEPIDLVAGHIPGAINICYLDNLTPDGRFLQRDALARQFKNALGSRAVKNVIVHCGSGVTACHTLMAMEAAGMSVPSLYVGSWSEWSRNQKPIATGEKP